MLEFVICGRSVAIALCASAPHRCEYACSDTTRATVDRASALLLDVVPKQRRTMRLAIRSSTLLLKVQDDNQFHALCEMGTFRDTKEY